MDKYISVLKKHNINYTSHIDIIEFYIINQKCKLHKDGKLFVDEKLFGEIPHVLKNGRVCTTGNQNIAIENLSIKSVFELTVTEYLPWLIALNPRFRVAEMLSEIDFYLNSSNIYKTKKAKHKPDKYEEIPLDSPLELWSFFDEMSNKEWYRLYAVDIMQADVYIMKDNNENIIIYYDAKRKAAQRVLGMDYKTYSSNDVFSFIGLGSVNSYIIKEVIAREGQTIYLFDDDIVSVDNAFRFAFPSKLHEFKGKCVERFAKFVDKNIQIHFTPTRIKTKTKKYAGIADSNYIFISVDDPFSWFETFSYVLNIAKPDTIVILSSVDAFGNFGKIMKFKINDSDKTTTEEIWELVIKYLKFTTADTRKQMIGNGCGKSISIYNEISLLKLASEVHELNFDKEHFGEVKYVSFK